jgi:hypothetical protein
MPSIYLHQGAVSPSDVTLYDVSHLALDAVAASGSGTVAVTLIKVGIETALQGGAGTVACSLIKIGVRSAAPTGSGAVAVVLIDVETLAASPTGTGALAASMARVGVLAAAPTGSGVIAVALDTAPAQRQSSGGSSSRGRAIGSPVLLSQLFNQPKSRTRRIKKLDVIEAQPQKAGVSLQITSVRPISVTLVPGSTELRIVLENDELLSDDTLAAIALDLAA